MQFNWPQKQVFYTSRIVGSKKKKGLGKLLGAWDCFARYGKDRRVMQAENEVKFGEFAQTHFRHSLKIHYTLPLFTGSAFKVCTLTRGV